MNLFVIGNGFDLNHGLKTSYKDFYNYIQHNSYLVSSFELRDLFYEYDDQLWGDFENNLDTYDFEQQMDWYIPNLNMDCSDREFERNTKDYRSLAEDFYAIYQEIHNVLLTAFSDFIIDATNVHDICQQEYFADIFNKDDYYVTFNYSKTLENLYKIPIKNILHLHGEASSYIPNHHDGMNFYPDSSIIFGHNGNEIDESNEPDDINFYLKILNNQLKKSFQYGKLKQFLSSKVSLIDDIQIIGHGLGPVDELYFKIMDEIVKTNAPVTYWQYDENDNRRSQINQTLHRLFPKRSCEILPY